METITRLTAARLFLAGLLVVGVSACNSGSSEVDPASLDPDAYQYKGATDPLLSVSGADRAGGLADRFDLVQGRQ